MKQKLYYGRKENATFVMRPIEMSESRVVAEVREVHKKGVVTKVSFVPAKPNRFCGWWVAENSQELQKKFPKIHFMVVYHSQPITDWILGLQYIVHHMTDGIAPEIYL